MKAAWSNWSGIVSCQPAELARPASLQELCDTVRRVRDAGGTLRVAGSGHSFSPLVATDGTLVSLDRLSGVVGVDPLAAQATVRAGTLVRDLGPPLASYGLALHNQGDIDAQTLAGAIATGTHGTGITLGSMSTQVAGLALVTADGEVVECSAQQDGDLFDAARLSLGVLGVVALVRLQLRPSYRLIEVKDKLPLEECLADAETHATLHRHFELFWFPHSDRVAIKTLDETATPPNASRLKRVVVDLLFENAAFWLVSEACRLRPSWSPAVSRLCSRLISRGERVDASYRIFPSPRLVRFNEMEYAVPAGRGPDCLRELRAVFEREGRCVHFPVEYRYVAADDIWLSPFHGRDSAVIAVHTYRGMPYEDFFAAAEAVFRNHRGRPHWGKCHRLRAAELAALYPRWEDFGALRRRLDPSGVFLTPYLRTLLGEPAS